MMMIRIVGRTPVLGEVVLQSIWGTREITGSTPGLQVKMSVTALQAAQRATRAGCMQSRSSCKRLEGADRRMTSARSTAAVGSARVGLAANGLMASTARQAFVRPSLEAEVLQSKNKGHHLLIVS